MKNAKSGLKIKAISDETPAGGSSSEATGALRHPPPPPPLSAAAAAASLRTRSSSCACRPSCAPSGWTAPGLSAGPAVDGPLTASPPGASLWTRPFVRTNTAVDQRGERWTGTERLFWASLPGRAKKKAFLSRRWLVTFELIDHLE